VPRADETTLFVDGTIGEIGAQVAAVSTDGEELAPGVPCCVTACAPHNSWLQFGNGSHFYFFAHRDLLVPDRNPKPTTGPDTCGAEQLV
jgi:hypothetical protein